MTDQSKCQMAYLRYCRKSTLGYCNASETELKNCPYLSAIKEITKLTIEKENTSQN